MPIYEYECLKNGHHFEVRQKIADKPLEKCKICHSPVRRLISSTSFVLKGGGWYAHDYQKKSTTPPATEKQSQTNGKTPETKKETPPKEKPATPEKKST